MSAREPAAAPTPGPTSEGGRSPGRVAVIDGASGYIGSNLARFLLDQGQTVLALSRRGEVETRRLIESAVVARGCALRLSARVTVVDYDLLAPALGLSGASRHAVFSRPCTYWHVAADVNFRPTFRDRLMAVNLEGTANTLAAFREHAAPGSHYAFVSSAYCCGHDTDQPVERWYANADDSAFRNYYEASKRRAELLVRDAIEAGMSGVVLRLGQVVGDSVTGESTSDYGVYNLMRTVWSVARRRPCEHVRIEAHPASNLHLVPIDACVRWMALISEQRWAALAAPVVHVIDRQSVPLSDFVAAVGRNVPLTIAVAEADDFARLPSTRLERIVAARMAYTGAYLDMPFVFGRDHLDRLTRGESQVLDDEALERVVSSFVGELKAQYPPDPAAGASARSGRSS